MRHVPVVQQDAAAECGLACLAMLAGYWGHQVTLGTLRRQHPVSLHGMTLRTLLQIAHTLHLTCRPLRADLGHLKTLALPALLHWDFNHFVVLTHVSRRGLRLHDPATGPYGAQSRTRGSLRPPRR